MLGKKRRTKDREEKAKRSLYTGCPSEIRERGYERHERCLWRRLDHEL